MRRRVLHAILVLVLGTVPLVLGVVAALIWTDSGHDLLARNASKMLDGVFRGDLEIGELSGSFLFGIELRDVVLKDTSGVTFARIPRMEVGYQVPNLLSGRFILSDVVLERPFIQLIKHPGGRMNYAEILRLGEGAGGGRPPLFDIRGLTIRDGTVRIATPWNPPDSARTPQMREAALAAQRDVPGRVIEDSPEGLRKVIVLDSLNARLPELRISTPARAPIMADIDSLATRVSDPAVDLRDFAGRVTIVGDTARIIARHGELPNTTFQGSGDVAFPGGALLLDLTFDAPRVDLRDVRGFVPTLPAFTGSTHFEAKSSSETRTSYILKDMHLGAGPTEVDGSATAVIDQRTGFTLEAFNVDVRAADLDLMRPYIDTIPFDGTITGALSGGGARTSFPIRFNIAFTDSVVPEHPVSLLEGHGRIAYGGPQGVVFTDFVLESSDIAMTTIREVVPAALLEGRLDLAGTINGPWQDAVYEGTIRHHDGDRPVSVARGRVHFNTLGTSLGLDSELRLDPLSFDGIRAGLPALRAQGSVTGTVQTSGTLEHLDVVADLQGGLGQVQARGTLMLLPPRFGADSFQATFNRLDLAMLTGRGLHTRLQGRLLATGVVDTLQAPEGSLRLSLGPSGIREAEIDSAFALVEVRDSLITVDTLHFAWANGSAAGAGTLGWAAPHSGRMTFDVTAATLSPFDSLVTSMTGMEPDSLAPQRLAGIGLGSIQLEGALDSIVVTGSATLNDLAYRQIASREIDATFEWRNSDRRNVAATVVSPLVQYGDQEFHDVDVRIGGRPDSLDWRGSMRAGSLADLSGGGTWYQPDSASFILALDSLTAVLPEHTWQLVHPTRIERTAGSMVIDSLELRPSVGGAQIRVNGEIPRSQPGQLAITGYGIDLKDVYGILQRDTADVSGSVGVELDIGGTARTPTITGTVTLGDARFGDFQAPFVQGVVNYENQQLEANLLLWRTGVQVLTVEARLPLDLAFTSVPKRQLDGPLSVRAVADSVDLALMEAFTPTVRRVQGLLKADVEVSGTWDAPQLDGFLEVQDGAATLPSLGVRYGYMTGRAHFAGDSIVIERLRTTSGPGDLKLAGSIRLNRLTDPSLNLTLEANRFRAIDDRAFLSLVVTGNATIKGPLYGAVLDGSGMANSGELHFADLLNKQVVDLTDPLARDLVDTTLIRKENLGAAFQNVFLDSLRIRNFQLEVGDEFWLRSSDANIQLEGSIAVSKEADRYSVDGTLNAIRGTYSLKIGFVTRDFQVERGQVRYFGTPDLNAELDIQATHVVQTQSEDVPIIANITGTLQRPQLQLTSTIRPQPTETELVSYLMFGRPNPELTSGSGGQERAFVNAAVALLSSALSSEFQRSLVSDFGIPIDYVEIRTGYSSIGLTTGLTQATFGWQLGGKNFLTVSAGVCGSEFGSLGSQSLGAGLEHRFSRVWRARTSIEPLQICTTGVTSQSIATEKEHQLGFDLLWEKEY